MLPLLARRMQASVGSAALPWWRRLGQSAASSHVAAAAAPSSSSLPSAVLSSGRRALATFAGGRSSSSSSAAGSRPAQQLDGSGHGGRSSGASASASTSSSPSPLGVPHFEIRVYDMEEALENLTRQHSVPLGYVLPVEDSMPAPTIEAPVVDTTPLPRLAPATAPASASSCEEEEGAGGEVMQCIKRTYQPSVLKRKRAHGFLSRLKNRDGRKILGRRRLKHRSRMGV